MNSGEEAHAPMTILKTLKEQMSICITIHEQDSRQW